MNKRIHFQISMLASVAAVAITGFNIYTSTQKSEVPKEFATDLSSVSEEPSRGIAGVEAAPDFASLYASAREFSANGKFDECLAALNTIHQQVTEFEGSRELKNFCSEGKFRKAQAAAAAAKRTKQRRVASRR